MARLRARYSRPPPWHWAARAVSIDDLSSELEAHHSVPGATRGGSLAHNTIYCILVSLSVPMQRHGIDSSPPECGGCRGAVAFGNYRRIKIAPKNAYQSTSRLA